MKGTFLVLVALLAIGASAAGAYKVSTSGCCGMGSCCAEMGKK